MTVTDVIDALGGYREAAKLFGVGHAAVCNWKAAGRFPQYLHLRVHQECRRRRIRVPEELLTSARRGKQVA